MKYSQLFGKTNKETPQEADSVNARFLIQGGFVDQLAAGIYSYLPLGWRVLEKIENIVREEMDAIGGQEILMPALHPSRPWKQTGRWDDPGTEVMFQFAGRGGKEYGLGWTHEEIVTELVKTHIHSYRDLPLALYQIQNKFRNEPRAKSGLLRGIEFSMKDLYSFHLELDSLEAFYDKVSEAYLRVFERCGLDAIVTEADGGAFSKFSHEFQVLTPNGEDIIFVCESCRYAQNKEISELQDGDTCPKCDNGTIAKKKAIEVGNIFKLKTRFSSAFDLTVTGEDGNQKDVLMGCYGIGPSRVMGSIVEVHHDDNGIVWPRSVAPFHVHLVTLSSKDEKTRKKIEKTATKVYKALEDAGIEVLWDDRDASPGEKFADADLIGLPLRLLISRNSLAEDAVEWKERSGDEETLVPRAKIVDRVKKFVNKDV